MFYFIQIIKRNKAPLQIMPLFKLIMKYSFLIICLCYPSLEAVNTDDGLRTAIITEAHSQMPLLKHKLFSSEFQTTNVSSSGCTCGKFSSGCEFQNGLKVCNCNVGYVQGNYQTCVSMCNETHKCNNGGSCFNNVCICKPGTSGPFCDTISGCSELKCENDQTANCSFDEKNLKPYCQCQKADYKFDYDAKVCKSCKCDKCPGKFCFKNTRKCEIIRGEKTCMCKVPNYKYNPKTQVCTYCNCGKNAVACEFDLDGNTKCICKYGYEQNKDTCERCSCFLGKCKFENNEKKCICNKGFSEYDGECKSCDCGDYGTCEYNNAGEKVKCNCKTGYMETDGKCIDMNYCYCGENSNCSFINSTKTCECSPGFQVENGLCFDIDECQNSSVCPGNMRCINTQGSYRCVCEDGFRRSSTNGGMICEDINECIESSTCPNPNTMCLNTVGSYACICEEGYLTRGGENYMITCENKSSWKIGYGFFMGIFMAIILGMMFAIYRKYQSITD